MIDIHTHILPGIILNPEIRGGKPVIEVTRVPVDVLLGKWLLQLF
ncbi:DUF433 domain-containing protein [Desulfothermobacter acidiphilus]